MDPGTACRRRRLLPPITLDVVDAAVAAAEVLGRRSTTIDHGFSPPVTRIAERGGGSCLDFTMIEEREWWSAARHASAIRSLYASGLHRSRVDRKQA
jgi:hypothetical protein